MGSFQTEQNPNMDSFNRQSGMVDPALANNVDMTVYRDHMSMDMTSLQTTPGFVQMDIAPPSTAIKTDTVDNVPSNNAGAGPLPTGFAVQNNSSGSTLTEFTKRRNWSQRVLDELKDLLYIVTPDGRLLYVSPSAKALTGYDSAELLNKSISDFIHPDDSSLFIREFNESIASGQALRFFYRFRTAEEKYRIFECHGHPHLTKDNSQETNGGAVSTGSLCRGFFMMARPYPTRNSELLDSFLEHKIENVRLQARIAALKKEEAEDAEAQQEQYHKTPGMSGSRTPSCSVEYGAKSPSTTSKGDPTDFVNMPPPAKPTVSNIALTREALDEANAFARPDSIRDKMARYEGSSHVDSIEMFTGLRYREGERSHGISTGGTSPALIRGDAGISIPVDKADSRYAGYSDKKPKKVKSADEYVCTDCGTLDSPEWRKGPNGPKTLCNACGLRWAKKEKKKSGGQENINTTDTNGAAGNNNNPAATGASFEQSNTGGST
jgi:PAS domain S-box-containing protein